MHMSALCLKQSTDFFWFFFFYRYTHTQIHKELYTQVKEKWNNKYPHSTSLKVKVFQPRGMTINALWVILSHMSYIKSGCNTFTPTFLVKGHNLNLNLCLNLCLLLINPKNAAENELCTHKWIVSLAVMLKNFFRNMNHINLNSKIRLECQHFITGGWVYVWMSNIFKWKKAD